MLALRPVGYMKTQDDTSGGDLRQPLIDIALDSWRFARLFDRVLGKLDAGDAPRYASQLRYFMKRLDESLEAAGLRIVSLVGQPYDTGVAASALNLGDFDPEDQLVIDQMIDPVLMSADGVVKTGTVIVRRAG
jgi:hypothetical protein